MKGTALFCLTALTGILLFGCGTTSSKKMTSISLGMNKEQVVSNLGNPKVVRGAVRNKFDQVVEVWEYRIAMPRDETVGSLAEKMFGTVATLGVGAILFQGEREDYWFYFVEDQLVQWGQAGDWSAVADQVYEMKFNTAPSLGK